MKESVMSKFARRGGATALHEAGGGSYFLITDSFIGYYPANTSANL